MQRASLLLALALTFAFAAQPPTLQAAPAKTVDGDDAAIRAAIEQQAAAWNHADIPGFMQSYEDSPETTFIGQSIGKGYNPILERYKKNYTTPEQMGTLTFNHL